MLSAANDPKVIVCFIEVSRCFQHYFSYIMATVPLSLGLQTSTRLENVPCPWTFHHDPCAATGDRTRDTHFPYESDMLHISSSKNLSESDNGELFPTYKYILMKLVTADNI